MWGLISMQLLINFRESNAIFTDLSLFTVITTVKTKQSHTFKQVRESNEFFCTHWLAVRGQMNSFDC